MKKIFFSAFFVLTVLLITPLFTMDKPFLKDSAPPAESGGRSARSDRSFRVCNLADGSVSTVSEQDYLFGVVAAEMPASYGEEALKAQAVAAYTFACRRREQNADRSYDLTTDPSLDQSFLPREEARKKWGDRADDCEKTIEAALSAVRGERLLFNGELILAAYHAISPGRTEACESVWGGDLPYLRAVASPGDLLAPDYRTTAAFSAEELAQKFTEECSLSGEPAAYFSGIKKTPSGTVLEITVCGKTLKGSRVRALLGLRSAAFDVEWKDGRFLFTVYGYGHGVGMSQYGASVMARQGADYREILSHYYPGTVLAPAE